VVARQDSLLIVGCAQPHPSSRAALFSPAPTEID